MASSGVARAGQQVSDTDDDHLHLHYHFNDDDDDHGCDGADDDKISYQSFLLPHYPVSSMMVCLRLHDGAVDSGVVSSLLPLMVFLIISTGMHFEGLHSAGCFGVVQRQPW